ncbi:hypothetical protein KMZ30_11935 [Phycicoccus sp. KQZ13P-1]|uniref:nuclear transport factor 2 family protein n=1 Tax=Phycicoccus mangrovi TaxID=2840470 RepID=UPI001C00309F|nr:hypothetical protein [Phycicoccus mangrovi]MBT9256283.1 hypothetical protein [Phycicoccus mangrovi]
MNLDHLGEPGRIMELWQAASIAQSLRAMEEIFDDDAIYEFPFTAAGFPSRIDGKKAIVAFLSATWSTGLIVYDRYETIAAYRAKDDPGVVIVEQDVYGTSSAAGDFILPNLIVAQIENGRIEKLRDYANLLAASQALGMRI